MGFCCFFFFKQKTAYVLRIGDWSADVCSSDLLQGGAGAGRRKQPRTQRRRHMGRVRDPLSPGGRADLQPDRLSRSEEHTSELQSLMRISYAVFCSKKKNTKKHSNPTCLQTYAYFSAPIICKKCTNKYTTSPHTITVTNQQH